MRDPDLLRYLGMRMGSSTAFVMAVRYVDVYRARRPLLLRTELPTHPLWISVANFESAATFPVEGYI